MFFRNILFLLICLFLSNCTTIALVNDKPIKTIVNGYSNKGFALVYNDDLYKQKIVSGKIDERSLIIFQKNLDFNTLVKITNILNNKSLIATVGKRSKYPFFNNSVLSLRIAKDLDLDTKEPYVEILEILENSIFIAGKAKTYDEEKNVAVKAPVNSINISDLKLKKNTNKKKPIRKFSYTIKIADFYFNETALIMRNRIKNERVVKNVKIKKISDKKYRVYLGPFNNINSLQKSFNDISILKFENIEILKND